MAEAARRLSSLPAPGAITGAPELALPPHVRRGARGGAFTSAGSPAAAAPAPWSRDALAGRLVELSSADAGAPLTMAVALVLDAQRRRETVAWVTSRESAFFPPDVAASGVDLDSLAVIRLPDPSCVARAADRLLRSGAFGLVLLDLVPPPDAASGAEGGAAGRTADGARAGARDTPRTRTVPAPSRAARARAAAAAAHDVSMPLQARLLGLAERHDAAVVCLTEKPRTVPSLSSLVSLRVEARRRRTDDGGFACTVESVKDKRRPPGWAHAEVRHGPPGLR